MNKYIYHIILLIISVLLYIFERNNMFLGDIVAQDSSSTVVVAMMLFILIYALLFSSKTFYKDKLYKRYTILIVFIYVISLGYSILYPLGSRVMYGTIILPLFSFIFTVKCTKYAKNNETLIWTMTIIAIMLSYYFMNNYYNNVNYNTDSQSNSSYTVLYILPFMLCHRNKIIRIMSIILVLLVVMFSLKRGGFIALFCSILVYLYISQISIKKRRINILSIILVIVAIVLLLYLIMYINDIFLSNSLFNRLEDSIDSEGSGRFSIYNYYWNLFKGSSLLQFIIGRGWLGSIRCSDLGLTCHNDFLEVLIDFGIIGLIFYLTFITSLIKFCGGMIKIKHEYAPAMGASIGLFLVNSMVSHIIIYSSYLILFSLFWGFMLYSMNNQYVKK